MCLFCNDCLFHTIIFKERKKQNLHPSLDLPVSQDHPITQIKTNALHQLHRDSVSLIV